MSELNLFQITEVIRTIGELWSDNFINEINLILKDFPENKKTINIEVAIEILKNLASTGVNLNGRDLTTASKLDIERIIKALNFNIH